MAVTPKELRELWSRFQTASKKLDAARRAHASEALLKQLVADADSTLTAWGNARNRFFEALGTNPSLAEHDWFIVLGDDDKPLAVPRLNAKNLYDDWHRYQCCACGRVEEVPAASYRKPSRGPCTNTS